ncbi:hypothetical protein GCM10009821_12180 [Aeromicrobium halocynthiae]|uniref:Htaa domain-containing protein n=1 Tax=Aeromicrobium halocynthiae TaxID=560557 RepID=A0ABN2VWR7_9ACTN
MFDRAPERSAPSSPTSSARMLLALALAVLLPASLLGPAGVSAAAAAPQGPSVEVSVSEFSVEGVQSVTVTGRGFDPGAATGTRPPLAGRPGGVYVVVGKFASSWRPSQGAPSSSRKVGSQKWAVLAEDMGRIGGPGAGAIELRPDGSFTAELVVDKAALDEGAGASLTEYGIYTYAGSGAVAPAYETATPITFTEPEPEPEPDPDPEPTGPRLDVTIVEQVRGRLAVDVRGAGYATTSPGIYVGIAESGGADPTDATAYRGTVFVPHTQMGAGGTFTRRITLDAAEIATLRTDRSYSLYTLKAHGQAVADPSQTVEKRLTLDVALLRGGTGTGGGQPAPTDPVSPGAPPMPGTGPGGGGGASSRTSGSLTWGVAADFRSYVTGPIARGSVSVAGGATALGGAYRFPQRSSDARGADARGTTGYAGSVRFSGHSGALSLTLADPSVVVQGGGRGLLTIEVDGVRRGFATLDLSAAARTRSGGSTTYRGAPARLTAEGASAFQGFYAAGRALDPVTFTVGADSPRSSAAARTVATSSLSSSEDFQPPATPPSRTGATIDVDDPDGIRAGDRITASADGFQPGEQGIAVVVYSSPVVLARDASADEDGRVEWTGNLPGDLEPGEHTLTFQGSVTRGVSFTVVEDDEVGPCLVEDATLTWGVKESFRAYVSGSIANGDWSTEGAASYETPEFRFEAGAGSLSEDGTQGDVEFDGALRFTGHGGALAVTLANPVVRFSDADSAVLMLDVTSGDRAAAEAGDTSTRTTTRVPFADLDLAAATRSDASALRLEDVPATLTEQGHGVFDSYEAGTVLDPVDLTATAADCGATAAPLDEAAGDAQPRTASVGATSGPSALWWGAGAAALVLTFAAGLWAGRRRGAAT